MEKPIWITTPSGERRLLLEARFIGGDFAGEGIEGYDYFLVTITKTDVRALLARMDKVKTLHDEDSNIETIEYYDTSGEWWPKDYESEDEEGNSVPLWAGRGDFDSRTELDRMTVTPAMLWWHAIPKHQDVHIETYGLTREALEIILTEANDDQTQDRTV